METQKIKRGDWVTIGESPLIGTVIRIDKDGSWADVDWGKWSKRMRTKSLEVHTTIHVNGEWSITDMTREKELREEIMS